MDTDTFWPRILYTQASFERMDTWDILPWSYLSCCQCVRILNPMTVKQEMKFERRRPSGPKKLSFSTRKSCTDSFCFWNRHVCNRVLQGIIPSSLIIDHVLMELWMYQVARESGMYSQPCSRHPTKTCPPRLSFNSRLDLWYVPYHDGSWAYIWDQLATPSMKVRYLSELCRLPIFVDWSKFDITIWYVDKTNIFAAMADITWFTRDFSIRSER